MSFIRLIDKFNKLLEFIAGVSLGLMTLSVFLQVFVRFVISKMGFEISAPWTEELSRYLMIWMIFIGGAIAVRRGSLIAVEALAHAVPATLGKAIKFISHLISLAFYGMILWIGLEWAQFGASETAPVLKISMIYVYSAMSVGAGFMMVNTIALLLDIFINKKDILANTDEEVSEVLHELEEEKKRDNFVQERCV